MVNICFLADDGCCFSGISGLIDSFNIANLWYMDMMSGKGEPLFHMEIVSPEGKPFRVNGGFHVIPHSGFSDVGKSDVVIISPFLPNADLIRSNAGAILDWIGDQYNNGASVAALCTGTFVLAETGLLNDRIATTNWLFARQFRARYPRVDLKPDRIITHDKGLICSGAVTAFYHLGLHLIETYGGKELASLCAKIFLVDESRTSQASYAIFNVLKSHGDLKVLNAQEWMEHHYTKTINMELLARQVGISSRHFIRRFKNATGESPLNYLQQIRVETAKKMLETRTGNIDEITRGIGYENSSTFRKLFKEFTGLSPREYRDKFARVPESV